MHAVRQSWSCPPATSWVLCGTRVDHQVEPDDTLILSIAHVLKNISGKKHAVVLVLEHSADFIEGKMFVRSYIATLKT